MTRRKASFLQGPTAAKYSLPAEDHRLNQAGLLIGDPTTAGRPLQVRPGVLVGPFSPGAVAVTTGGVNVNPFHAVVQGTVNGTQGPYLLTSDAVEFRAVTAASASEFRRGYVLVHVYDQVSGIDVQDNWDVEVVYGPNAATAGAATLPSRTANSVILKEFAVSNTGVITLVAASGEFTGPRGGILPVLADGANVPGHDGAAGSFDGHYRDHPTYGLQRWTAAAGWQVVGLGPGRPQFTGYATGGQSIAGSAWVDVALDAETVDTHNGHVLTAGSNFSYFVQVPGWYRLQGGVAFAVNATGFRGVRIMGHPNGGADTNVGGSATMLPTQPYLAACQPTPVRRVLAGVNDSFRLQAYQNGAAGLALANSAAGFGDQCSFLEIVYDGPP
jgi:hypothetical protein